MQKLTLVAALLIVALAGCQSTPPTPEPQRPPAPTPPKPVPPPERPPPQPAPVPVPTPSERALTEGIGLYEAGDFNGAIKTLLGAKVIWDDSTPEGLAIKVDAHKYIAFSYCVTKRLTLCRQQFVEAIKLNPNFNLDPAEKTHPIWGPEFERAKKQAAAPAPPPRRPPAPTPPRPSPPKAP
jgi:hypothetical protein